ncbi:MAG: hypothetical protein LBF41_03275 [Deltaproteobacteria bacterium]|jgi:hypothetical protein|nr:hypothetical protein [Deltaproteobacteria bacterium]
MSNTHDKVAAIKRSCGTAKLNTREIPPPAPPELFREREALSQSSLKSLRDQLDDLLETNKTAADPAPEPLIARITYTVLNLLTRGGFWEDAVRFFKTMDSYELNESKDARALSLLSLVFCCLTHSDLQEAKKNYLIFKETEPLCPMFLRHRAEAAYYFAFEHLRSGGDATVPIEHYEEIKAKRDDFDFTFHRRVEEIPVRPPAGDGNNRGDNHQNGHPNGRDEETGEIDPVKSFPLILEADLYDIFSFDLPDDLPKVGPRETTSDIMAAYALVLSVWHGTGGDLAGAKKWFGEISLWPGPRADELRAMGGVFLTHYMGAEDPLEAKLFYEKLFRGGTAPAGEPAEPTLGEKYPELAARGAINLMEALGKPEEMDIAGEIFRDLHDIPAFRKDPLLISRASLNFMGLLTQRGRFAEAKEIYDSIPGWWDSIELKTLRGKAAIDLIYYLGLRESPAKAREIYDGLLVWGAGRDLSPIKGRAAAVLISVYEAKADIKSALEVFWALESGVSLAGDLERAHAAHSIIRMHGKAGEPKKALDVFLSLGDFGDSVEMDRQRLGAAVNLILILGRGGLPKKARELYSRLPAWGTSPELDYLRAKASVNLISVYEELGDAKRAQLLYDSMVVSSNSPLILEKAKAAVTLMGVYGKSGDPAKARRIYDDFPKLERKREYDLEFDTLRQSAIINLVTAYAMKENWREALAVLTGDVGASLDNPNREELIKRLDYIMSLGGGLGKKDNLTLLSLFAEKLKNPIVSV